LFILLNIEVSMQFEAVTVACSEQECPNFNVVVETKVKLDEHGCKPWMSCGVCQSTLIQNPHPFIEQTDIEKTNP
jgi:hypothetical protein